MRRRANVPAAIGCIALAMLAAPGCEQKRPAAPAASQEVHGEDPRQAPAATEATGAVPATGVPALPVVPQDLATALREQQGKGLTTPLSSTDYSDDPDFKVPETLPRYAGTSGLAGQIRFSGSSTLTVVLMTWLRAYEELQPDVKIVLEGGSSAAAVPALIAGAADVGMLSRHVSDEERKAFVARFGYEPTEFRVGADAIAVFVNRRNPLPSLTVDQLERIFGRDPQGALPVEDWGELGLEGEWKDRPITVVGPRAGLGGHDVFQNLVLRGRPFRTSIDYQVVDHSVVNAAGSDIGTIGFASRFLATRRTRIVPLAPRADAPAVLPNRVACLTGTYPLARPLCFVINVAPGSQVPPAVQDFVRYAMSYEGQRDSAARGDYPVSREITAEAYAAVGLKMPAAGPSNEHAGPGAGKQ